MGAIARSLLGLLVVAGLASAQTSDVLDLVRHAAEALADNEPNTFLDLFDRKSPQFPALHTKVEALLAAPVASTIDVVSDEGSATKRELKLDWVIRVGRGEPRRQLVTCEIEKQGKRWKIVSIAPLELFD